MSEDKRSRILEAATGEFCKNGYQKASVASIAAKAGVAVGTVYSCFKNKESLFEAARQPEMKDYNPGKEQKKAEILKAALRIFRKNGYASTTMNAVANACGCNKAVLYQYFKSKEELFKAVFYQPQFSHMLERLCFSQTNMDLADVLKCMGTSFLNLFEDPDRVNLLKMVISESNRFPQLGALMYENTIQQVSENVTDILKQLADQGTVAEINYKLAARSYFGLLYSFVLIDKILNPGCGQYSNEQIVDFAADVFNKGLK